jgi:phospholipid/cholesterol/gamma-HCH transport system substrate-binding protein
MPSQRTKLIVGLFLAGGIGLVLVAVIWLGTSRYLEKGRYYVTYFNESVQGLDKDSPVKYRGVPIGRVVEISVAPDSKLIKVVLKIESGQTLGPDMVAQLKVVGITGAMFVELDQKKPGEQDRSPKLTFPSEYPIVASKPSEIAELLRGVDEIINNIKSLDMAGISDRVKGNLDQIEMAIVDLNVKGLSKKAESSLDSFNRVLDNQKWDRILASADNSAQSLNELLGKANATVERANKLLVQIEGITVESRDKIMAALSDFKRSMENANLVLEKGIVLLNSTDATLFSLRQHLLVTAQNMERTSENLNRLSDILAAQPSQLLFGEAPPRREVEPEVSPRE